MKSVPERLTPIVDHNGDPVYAEPEIGKVATRVIDLFPRDGMSPHGLLAACEPESGDPHDAWTEVALFEWAGGPATKDGVEVEPSTFTRVFHGGGPARILRELRHTYWGEPNNAGYIFYPNGKLICAAFEALKEWFDCD